MSKKWEKEYFTGNIALLEVKVLCPKSCRVNYIYANLSDDKNNILGSQHKKNWVPALMWTGSELCRVCRIIFWIFIHKRIWSDAFKCLESAHKKKKSGNLKKFQTAAQRSVNQQPWLHRDVFLLWVWTIFNVPLNERLKLGLSTQLWNTEKTTRTLCHHEPKAIWTVDWGIHTKQLLIQCRVSLKELTDIVELMTLKQKQRSLNICLGNEEK